MIINGMWSKDYFLYESARGDRAYHLAKCWMGFCGFCVPVLPGGIFQNALDPGKQSITVLINVNETVFLHKFCQFCIFKWMNKAWLTRIYGTSILPLWRLPKRQRVLKKSRWTSLRPVSWRVYLQNSCGLRPTWYPYQTIINRRSTTRYHPVTKTVGRCFCAYFQWLSMSSQGNCCWPRLHG